MDEKMKCEVVQDLLPLYVDGACTDGSRKLVEEHVKTCPGCKKLLEGMTTPLPEQAEAVQTMNLKPQKAFQKLRRRNFAICLLLILVVIVACPVIYLSYHTSRGQGISWTNLEELQESASLMELWQEEGTAAFVEQLEPVLLYETYATTPDELEIRRSFGMNGGEAYVPIELGGYRFMMAEHFYNQLTNGNFVEDHTLLESGDVDGLWRLWMQEHANCLILPAEIYERVREDDSDRWWDKLNLDCGEYYYYYTMNDYVLDFPDEMYANIEGVESLSDVFFIIQGAVIVPEELYLLHSEMMKPISGWYEAYAAYWQNVGYEAFAQEWRSEMRQIFDEADLELTITGVALDDMMTTGRKDCYIISWNVTFSDGNILQIYLSEYDGNYYLIYTHPVAWRSNDLAESINAQLPKASLTVPKD